MILLSILILASPPPDWQVLPAPEGHSVNRVAWSPDGQRLAICGTEAVTILEAPVQQLSIAAHACSDIIFDGETAVFSVAYPKEKAGVWQTTGTAPVRLTNTASQALAKRGETLWIAGDKLTIWANGAAQRSTSMTGVRRLVNTPQGMLVLTSDAVTRVDDQLAVQRRYVPTPVADGNGLYDVVALPDQRIAAVDNRGSLWIWRPDGTVDAHAFAIGSANSLVWTGRFLVIGDIWVDPITVRPVARAFRQPRSSGPLAISSDRSRIAVPLHRGILLRPAHQTNAMPRGMPASAGGMVVTPDGVWLGDRDGRLIEFDHTGTVRAVHAISKDGIRDLVGDPGKTLYAATEWGDIIAWRKSGPYVRWDTRSGERLALTQDGKTLYVGGQRTADRIDTRTGQRTAMQPMREDEHPTFWATLTPKDEVIWFRRDAPASWHRGDGSTTPLMTAAAGHFDRRGRLWTSGYKQAAIYDWTTQKKIKQIEGLRESRFVPLPDGGMVVSGWSGSVAVFAPDGTLRWDKHAPWHVGAIAPVDKRLLTGGPDLAISAWTLSGERTEWAPPGRGQSVSGMAFSADGRFLAVGADSTGLRVWDLQTHRMVRDLAMEPGDIYVHRNAAHWLIRQHERVVRWPVGGGAHDTIKLPERWGSSWNDAHTTAPFILQEGEPATQVIDLRTGKAIWQFVMPDSVRTAAVAPSGQSVAILVPGEKSELQIHHQKAPVQRAPGGFVRHLSWHGNTLWAREEEKAFVWDGKRLQERKDMPAFATRIAHAGSTSAYSDGVVVKIRRDGKLLRALPIEHHGEAFLELSPNGSILAVGGNFTGSVVLWSVESGTPIARYEAFADGLWRSTDALGKRRSGKTIRQQK